MPEVFESKPKRPLFVEVKKRTLDFLQMAGHRTDLFDLHIVYHTDGADIHDTIRYSNCDSHNNYTATPEWREFWRTWSTGRRSKQLHPPLTPADLRDRLKEFPCPSHVSETGGTVVPYFAPLFSLDSSWSDTPTRAVAPKKPRTPKAEALAA